MSGEFIRLALEEAGADYVDVARRGKAGMASMMKLMADRRQARPPYAPPFLKVGQTIVAQTANVLLFLGPRLNLAPRDEAARLWAHQLQLTISDLVDEIHDTHHPVSSWLSFEEQRPAARRRSRDFWHYRVPKYLGYFERVLTKNGGRFILGRRLGYVDLSLFQIVEGLRYAFPRRMKRFERKIPGLVALHETAADSRLSGIAAAHSVQSMGHLSLFQRARCLRLGGSLVASRGGDGNCAARRLMRRKMRGGPGGICPDICRISISPTASTYCA